MLDPGTVYEAFRAEASFELVLVTAPWIMLDSKHRTGADGFQAD